MFKIVTPFLAHLFFSCSKSQTLDSEVKIMGGVKVHESSYSHQIKRKLLSTVAISSVKELKGSKVFCTGSYYRDSFNGKTIDYVITASHCLVKDDKEAPEGKNIIPYEETKNLRVIFGEDSFDNKKSFKTKVLKTYVHPEYSTGDTTGVDTDVNDVAILVLPSITPKVVSHLWGEVIVEPFGLKDVYRDKVQFNQPVIHSGFGIKNYGSLDSSGVLRLITNQIRAEVDYHHIQTYPIDYKFQSTCKGDSGGPSFVITGEEKLQQLGVHLGGEGFCDGESFDTHLSPYVDWIQKTLEEHKVERRWFSL